jgi:Carboxypeptidase regulatory-like domain
MVLRVLRVLVLMVPGVLVLTVLLVPVSAQTPAPARDGVITGQVVDGVSGRPVSAAIVRIDGTPPPTSDPGLHGRAGILTAADGRFVFRDLRDGSFTITATKGGYAEGASGRRRPGGASQAVTLTAAQPAADIAVRVWKNGAIGGTVLDEAGEPVVGVRVSALLRTATLGRSQLVPATGAATTDDRGAYRFSNLSAGDYLVLASPPPVSVKVSVLEDVGRGGRGIGELGVALSSAMNTSLIVGDTLIALGRGNAIPPSPRGGRLQIYPPTLHPSALAPAQASTVTLGAGEERAGIDIQLVPASTARVSGILIGPSGPADMARLQLVPARGEELPADVMSPTTFTDSTGAFTFAGVVPGNYALRATRSTAAGGSGSDLFWVNMPIAVAGDDIEGVAAVLAPPLRITARYQFDGSAPRPAAQPGRFVAMPFSLEPVDKPAGPVSIAATLADGGGFTVAGYLPGRYRVRVSNSPQGWMFKAAMLNGADVSEVPFELTRDVPDLVLVFTDRWSGMSGSVQGPAADAATVILFTTDTQAWTGAGANPRRFRSARATAKGQFGISSLPPGDYYVVAIRDEDAADWRDPAALEAFARLATQVTIQEGEHKTIDLQLREVRR